jgi:uncharacterized membrane protein YhaH (DUF805 family)
VFEEAVAVKMIVALRGVVFLTWAAIGIWGIPSCGNIITGRTGRGDYFWGSMTLLALGLLIFQYRSLSGVTPPDADYYTFVGLISLALSAVGIFVTRASSAHDQHKRAAMISHFVLLTLLGIVGVLS